MIDQEESQMLWMCEQVAREVKRFDWAKDLPIEEDLYGPAGDLLAYVYSKGKGMTHEQLAREFLRIFDILQKFHEDATLKEVVSVLRAFHFERRDPFWENEMRHRRRIRVK